MNADSLVMGVPLWVVALAAGVVALLLLLILLAISKSGSKSKRLRRARPAVTPHPTVSPFASTGGTAGPTDRPHSPPSPGRADQATLITRSAPKNEGFSKADPGPAATDAQPLPADPPPSAGMATTKAGPTEILVPTSDADAWELCWGLRHRVVDGRLQVDGAIRSGAGLPAEPGATYLCEYSVRAPRNLMGGRPLIYFAGPIALNAQGEMIQTFAEQAPITVDEGARKGTVWIEAASDAHSIYVGLQGPTGDDKLGVLPEFDWIRLTRQ